MTELLVGPVNVQEEWTNWKAANSKTYDSEAEEQRRFQIFERNIQEIQEHNRRFQAGDETYSKALNSFTDLNSDELPGGGGVFRTLPA